MASRYKHAVEALLAFVDTAGPCERWSADQFTQWDQCLTALRVATLEDVTQAMDEQLDRDLAVLTPPELIRFGMVLQQQRLHELQEVWRG